MYTVKNKCYEKSAAFKNQFIRSENLEHKFEIFNVKEHV